MRTEPRRSWIPAGVVTAALVIIAAVGLLLMRRGADELMSGNAEVVLAAPAQDARFASGTSFVWRPYADAARYSVELLDADGETVWRRIVTDTTAVLPSVPLTANAAYTWFVVALRPDGTTTRSPDRTIVAR